MYSNESTAGPKPQFEMGEPSIVSDKVGHELTFTDKEGEDKFCRFVDRMPPVSSDYYRSYFISDHRAHSLETRWDGQAL